MPARRAGNEAVVIAFGDARSSPLDWTRMPARGRSVAVLPLLRLAFAAVSDNGINVVTRTTEAAFLLR